MATAYYVDGDNGSDANSGLSEALAKQTIQAAVDAATGLHDNGSVRDFDAIYIQNNGSTVYSEAVAIASKCLRIVGYGSTITDGVIAKLDGASSLGVGIYHTTGANFQSVSIENMEIHGFTSHGIHLAGGSPNYNQRLCNVHCHDNGGRGALCTSCSYGTSVLNSSFISNTSAGLDFAAQWSFLANIIAYDNGSYGINVNSRQLSMSFCSVVKNGADGIRATSAADGNFLVANCTADKNTGSGIYTNIPQARAVIVQNCVFTRQGSYGIRGVSNTPLIMLYSCGFGTSSWANTSGDSTGISKLIETDGVTGDPQYVLPYDSSTNPTPANWDYGITNQTFAWGSSGLGSLASGFTTQRPRGAQVVIPAGGGGVAGFPIGRLVR